MADNKFVTWILKIIPDDDSLDVKDVWKPDSVIKFGCDVNVRSINEEKLSRICVRSFVICYSPICDFIL